MHFVASVFGTFVALMTSLIEAFGDTSINDLIDSGKNGYQSGKESWDKGYKEGLEDPLHRRKPATK